MSIQWYPGHMHKATREIREMLPKVDLIIEVVDARLPYSSANPVIARLRGNKPCIKLLNKSDLADPTVTEQWLEYLNSQPGTRAMAINMSEGDRIQRINDLCFKLVPKQAESIGYLNAMIMGIPNVGKSTLINALAGRVVAKTGNEPAVTKSQQRINLNNGIMLFDTPGILWPKVENPNSGYRLALTGAIKDTAIDYDDIGFYAADFLLKHYPELLKQRYQLDSLPATELEFLEIIGRKRGCLGGGGRVDLNKICKLLLTELRDGTLGPISLETPAMAAQETIETATQMQRQAEEKAARKAERKQRFNKRKK